MVGLKAILTGAAFAACAVLLVTVWALLSAPKYQASRPGHGVSAVTDYSGFDGRVVFAIQWPTWALLCISLAAFGAGFLWEYRKRRFPG